MTSSGYPAAGEMIGPYRVGHRLGGGGMGVVHEALDTQLERRVALKVIAPHLAGDAAFRARFTREARAQASLDSPHVVTVHAHGETDGRLWIATQLVPDGDLGVLLTRYAAPPVRVAVDLVAQVASGLADAHAAGLVHRDIKPANVLLRRRDGGYHALLADFGLARTLTPDATVTARSTMGTPRYMAPELHTGGAAGTASDVYSTGCLLWATLTGRAPYAGTSDFEIVTAHREEPVPQLEGDDPLVPAVNAVLRRSMAKDPAERYPTAAELRDALRAALAPGAPRLPPEPPAVPVPPRRSSRGLVLLAVLVLLGVVGAVGATYVLTRGDVEPVEAGGPAAPAPSPATSPASPQPSEPSGSPPEAEPAPGAPAGDEERAVASMAGAVAEQTGVSPEQATCAARSTIDAIGLAELVAIGFFTDDLAFADLELGPHPEVRAALTSAVLGCLT